MKQIKNTFTVMYLFFQKVINTSKTINEQIMRIQDKYILIHTLHIYVCTIICMNTSVL